MTKRLSMLTKQSSNRTINKAKADKATLDM